MTEELVGYIKGERARGVSDEKIRQALFDAGWMIVDIEEAMEPVEHIEPALPQSVRKSRVPKKFLLAVGFLLLVALLIAGGVYAYQNVFLSPERIVGRMLLGLGDIKSFSYESRFEVKQADISYLYESSAESAILTASGFTDINDGQNPKSRADIDLMVQGQSVGRVEFLSFGESFYFKLYETAFDELFNLTPIREKWVKVELTDVGADEQVDSTEVYEKIKAEFMEHPPFKIDKQLEGQEINGVNTYHYSYMLDEENFVEFANGVSETLGFEGAEKIGIEDVTTSVYGEIWIGKGDMRPYKLTVNVVDDNGSLNGEITMGRFNEIFEASAPSEFMGFEEAIMLIVPEGNLFSEEELDEIYGELTPEEIEELRQLYQL